MKDFIIHVVYWFLKIITSLSAVLSLRHKERREKKHKIKDSAQSDHSEERDEYTCEKEGSDEQK